MPPAARVLLIGFALAASGCASLEPAQLEARNYANADHENVFRDYRANCQRNGGRVYIMASDRVGRDGIPNRGDRYFCY